MFTNPLKETADLEPGTRVVVAMSGGVDSSAVAALAVDAGFEVLGITLQLYDHGKIIDKKGACCAGRDIQDARRVCDTLGIPHYVLDYEQTFRREVIDDFAESYLRGETPIPCIRCNQKVKFRDLLGTTKDLGARALLTGHYVQRFLGPTGRPELHQAVDVQRDQSYFLFATTSEQLSFCRFPLGGVPHKDLTRQVAASHGLPVAQKPDSQDICFVVQGSYHDTVRQLRPEASHKGQIVHRDGTILGEHEGITHYTVGQRKGLGVAWHEPLYVVALDVAHHRVIVGPRAALACREIHLKDVTWLSDRPASEPLMVTVKLRSTHGAVKAHVWAQGSQAIVRLEEPEYGISPGQACVFYHETQVLGGGWILRGMLDDESL